MKSWFLLLFSLVSFSGRSQFIFRQNRLPEKVSLLEYSRIADLKHQKIDPQEFPKVFPVLPSRIVKGEFANLGFTDHNYLLRFDLVNTLPSPLTYYLETAEPMTDHVNLYFFQGDKLSGFAKNGDDMAFRDRSVPFRDPVFKINLKPFEKRTAYLELINDGEKNNLPLNLMSPEYFFKSKMDDQIFLGLFYGILIIIVITYIFFYFALKEKSFLYYSLYVFFMGLCHFSLDGLFHEYITPENSWLNLHSVILFAIPASFFFGKYSEVILDIPARNQWVNLFFKLLYILLGMTFLAFIGIPGFLKFSYPVVNILTLLGILLIITSVLVILIKRQALDLFYTAGISIMFVFFTIVILINFQILPESLSLNNITKIGVGLEIIALSLSMANRIGKLNRKKEELQDLALQKSQEMNEIKSNFLSNMSHELRTPLNAILGITNILDKENSDPKLKSNFQIIKSASFNLISSVNDILDFSKIEKGELKLEEIEFNPNEIFQKIAGIYELQAKEKGINFFFQNDLNKGLILLGDPLRLEQVVNNIINNALKYTPQGSIQFQIQSDFTPEGKQKIQIKISDTGIGISADKLANIFAMFSQVDIHNKRKFGGFGIGLCVSKALVDLQQGKISLQSKLDMGTTCQIQLDYPVVKQELAPPPYIKPDQYDLRGKHILVVEDNPMNQMVLKLMLRKWLNTTVSFAENGQIGVDFLKTNEVDLVLMDLQMPIMDGYEATELVRKGHAGIQNTFIPIIVVTADITESTKARVFEIGVDDYMTKPVDQDLLFQKISNLFSERKSEELKAS